MTSKTETRVIQETRTPSGIEIQYEAKPKRLYRIRDDMNRTMYDTDDPWREVPSVTQVLDILSKPALTWWGMRTGFQAVVELNARGYASEDAIGYEKLATEHKLTVNHMRDKASDRGLNVHSALEKWIEDRTLPVVEFYPESEQGYVRGLLAFLTDLGEVTSTQTEVMVGSVEHGYAGRYDLEARLRSRELVINAKTNEFTEIAGGLWLLDAKTSKGIYTTQYIQLEAYEQARVECGYKPTKGRMIVRFSEDGKYEVGISRLSFDHFLPILNCYRALEEAKEAQRG